MENPTETLNIFINKLTQGITVWQGVLCRTEQAVGHTGIKGAPEQAVKDNEGWCNRTWTTVVCVC